MTEETERAYVAVAEEMAAFAPLVAKAIESIEKRLEALEEKVAFLDRWRSNE